MGGTLQTLAMHESRRSGCYRLLASCFYPPDRDQLLADGICSGLSAELEPLSSPAALSAAEMQKHLPVLAEMQLRIDHAALFVGPFALKAPPYGSVHLEEGRGVMGETTVAVANFYASAGLRLTLKEPADHIAVELEFMHYLAALAGEALTAGNREGAEELARTQLQFLQNFLAPWIPGLCKEIRSEAETPYFRALADCLEAFISSDLARLRQNAGGPG